jgi:hypothetical protein
MAIDSIKHILDKIYKQAESSPDNRLIRDKILLANIDKVCTRKHACTRLLMACLLGKIDNPSVDPRKPYTQIASDDSFSGRSYDEGYLTEFITKYHLPCNKTTAFLTPVFRTINQPLTLDITFESQAEETVAATLQLLDDVANNRIDAKLLLMEMIRTLLAMRDENKARLESLLHSCRQNSNDLPLSSTEIIHLIQQHLQCKHSSRLPVLVVAAAYQAAEKKLGERILPLHHHTAADSQTGAMGDVEICLEGDDKVVTVYEMKQKKITKNDIDSALCKIAKNRIHNYIFISTEVIDDSVAEYAASFYQKTGTEIAILDCLGFLRHFLHFFHRLRSEYLDTYQSFLLQEPDSSVNQSLKETFLILRKNAETME